MDCGPDSSHLRFRHTWSRGAFRTPCDPCDSEHGGDLARRHLSIGILHGVRDRFSDCGYHLVRTREMMLLLLLLFHLSSASVAFPFFLFRVLLNNARTAAGRLFYDTRYPWADACPAFYRRLGASRLRLDTNVGTSFSPSLRRDHGSTTEQARMGGITRTSVSTRLGGGHCVAISSTV